MLSKFQNLLEVWEDGVKVFGQWSSHSVCKLPGGKEEYAWSDLIPMSNGTPKKKLKKTNDIF